MTELRTVTSDGKAVDEAHPDDVKLRSSRFGRRKKLAIGFCVMLVVVLCVIAGVAIALLAPARDMRFKLYSLRVDSLCEPHSDIHLSLQVQNDGPAAYHVSVHTMELRDAHGEGLLLLRLREPVQATLPRGKTAALPIVLPVSTPGLTRVLQLALPLINSTLDSPQLRETGIHVKAHLSVASSVFPAIAPSTHIDQSLTMRDVLEDLDEGKVVPPASVELFNLTLLENDADALRVGGTLNVSLPTRLPPGGFIRVGLPPLSLQVFELGNAMPLATLETEALVLTDLFSVHARAAIRSNAAPLIQQLVNTTLVDGMRGLYLQLNTDAQSSCHLARAAHGVGLVLSRSVFANRTRPNVRGPPVYPQFLALSPEEVLDVTLRRFEIYYIDGGASLRLAVLLGTGKRSPLALLQTYGITIDLYSTVNHVDVGRMPVFIGGQNDSCALVPNGGRCQVEIGLALNITQLEKVVALSWDNILIRKDNVTSLNFTLALRVDAQSPSVLADLLDNLNFNWRMMLPPIGPPRNWVTDPLSNTLGLNITHSTTDLLFADVALNMGDRPLFRAPDILLNASCHGEQVARLSLLGDSLEAEGPFRGSIQVMNGATLGNCIADYFASLSVPLLLELTLPSPNLSMPPMGVELTATLHNIGCPGFVVDTELHPQERRLQATALTLEDAMVDAESTLFYVGLLPLQYHSHVTVIPPGCSVSVAQPVALQNNFPFPLTLQRASGDVYLNNTDGSSLLFWNYPPDEHFLLGPLSASNTPLTLEPLHMASLQGNLNMLPTTERCARLVSSVLRRGTTGLLLDLVDLDVDLAIEQFTVPLNMTLDGLLQFKLCPSQREAEG